MAKYGMPDTYSSTAMLRLCGSIVITLRLHQGYQRMSANLGFKVGSSATDALWWTSLHAAAFTDSVRSLDIIVMGCLFALESLAAVIGGVNRIWEH